MYAESEQHCFHILLPRGFEDSSVPLTPPTPPPLLPSYLFRLREADAVISWAFNSLSHPLASPFFKRCLPPLFWMLLPVVPRYLLGGKVTDAKLSRGVKKRKKKRNHHKGQIDGRKQGSYEWKTEGCHCNTVVFPSVFKADLIDFANLKHSHCRTFHRPIDWNWLPWSLKAINSCPVNICEALLIPLAAGCYLWQCYGWLLLVRLNYCCEASTFFFFFKTH